MIDRTNPIKISLVNKDEYKISISLDGWELNRIVSSKAIADLQKEINEATGITKIIEVFQCSGEEARRIRDFWEMKNIKYWCTKDCSFKWKECYACAIMCQSPLERDLLLELRKNDFNPILQRRINKDGSFYEFPKELDFDNILTIPDFYIETPQTKLCIFADGHSFHERTQHQALRDRNIDRELQRIGYKVLRYTGLEIRNDCSQVVENIKKNL